MIAGMRGKENPRNADFGLKNQFLFFADQVGKGDFGMVEQGAIFAGFQFFAQEFDVIISVVPGGFQHRDEIAEGDNALAQPATVLFAVGRAPGIAQLDYGYIRRDFGNSIDEPGIEAEMICIQYDFHLGAGNGMDDVQDIINGI